MDRKLLRTLLIFDRATGATERIHELDGRFFAFIASAASRAGLTCQQALEILEAGQDITTTGFVLGQFGLGRFEPLPDLVRRASAKGGE
jgi:hypothetical protein